MKYNPDAYTDYPLLRPHSSDYPDGRISTLLTRRSDEKYLHIEISFEIDEPMIRRQIEEGVARCCAFLYCTGTCYSEMLTADGTTVISASVPLNRLKGRVEINPSVIAVDDLVVRTDTAHPEYAGASMPVQKYRQLAMDEPWHLGVVGPIESVFRLEKADTDTLEDGEFDFLVDPGERYIVIRSNPKTYHTFDAIRKRNHTPLTKASVYLTALTAGLGALHEEPDDTERDEGWAATVREHIRKLRIPWPDSCGDGVTAQRLLGNPLDALPSLSDDLVRVGANRQ